MIHSADVYFRFERPTNGHSTSMHRLDVCLLLLEELCLFCRRVHFRFWRIITTDACRVDLLQDFIQQNTGYCTVLVVFAKIVNMAPQPPRLPVECVNVWM